MNAVLSFLGTALLFALYGIGLVLLAAHFRLGVFG
jgi:hypothetical protein